MKERKKNLSRKKITRARRRKNTSACDEFLDMGFLLFNRYSLEYRGHPSLGFALISYSKYKYENVFEYLEDMKQYDLKTKNYKRLEEIKQIENLTEKEILRYGKIPTVLGATYKRRFQGIRTKKSKNRREF